MQTLFSYFFLQFTIKIINVLMALLRTGSPWKIANNRKGMVSWETICIKFWAILNRKAISESITGRTEDVNIDPNVCCINHCFAVSKSIFFLSKDMIDWIVI